MQLTTAATMQIKPPPGLLWHAASTATIATTGILCRLFLYGTQHLEIDGMEIFLTLLKARRKERSAGLLTVSNHISVVDDPLMWGLLPFSCTFSPRNMRYGLGSHDICFKNHQLGVDTIKTNCLHPFPPEWGHNSGLLIMTWNSRALSSFFAAGQVLPTFRLHKDSRGGLFQPSISEAISLLGTSPYNWVHIFPEGRVHQSPNYEMRYFKWGVSRLLLEPSIQPILVPMFMTGFSDIMHESRGFPRLIPRVGKRITLHIGNVVPEDTFLDLRSKWHDLMSRYTGNEEYLKTGKEAVELRVEATKRIREEVVKLRRKIGFPEEGETAAKVET